MKEVVKDNPSDISLRIKYVYVYTSYNKMHRNYNMLFSIKLDRDDNSSYDINRLLPLLQTRM